jgi:hypothetical protein
MEHIKEVLAMFNHTKESGRDSQSDNILFPDL